MSREPELSLIGRMIAGKFAIDTFLGGGAMGAVFRARQVALDKIVAIKVLHRELGKDEMFAGRFLREAKAASRIDHPNSMRVLDFGEEPDGLLYIAMEFLDGRDLYKVIQDDWPLSNARIVDVLMQTLAALAVAHDMGVVHRDLKPENIMILRGTDDEGNTRDVVKVCDFGIAKITEKRSDLAASGPKLTTQGLVVGTPEYMSPEQGRGEQLDARSDLYSVGVILFQLLTGRVPFEAESALGVVLKHVTDEPPAPSSINPRCDPRLERIVLKAMRKKREDRYQSARELRGELRTAVDLGLTGPLVSLDPNETSAAIGNAQTAVAIDSDAVRRISSRTHAPTQSKVTPIGTETLVDSLGPRPRRWAGFVLAGLVLVGVGAGAVWKLRPMVIDAKTNPPPSANRTSTGGPASATTTATTGSPVTTGGTPTSDPGAGTSSPTSSGTSGGVGVGTIKSGTRPSSSGKPGASSSAAPSGAPAGSAPPIDPRTASPPLGPSGAPSAATSASASPSAAPSGSAAPVGFPPDKAKVVMKTSPSASGAEVAPISKMLTAELPAMTACYRQSFKTATTKPVATDAKMHVEGDANGQVTSVAFSGGAVPDVTARCITDTMKATKVPGVDGTHLALDVDLSFIPD